MMFSVRGFCLIAFLSFVLSQHAIAQPDRPIVIAGTFVPLALEDSDTGSFARLSHRIAEIAGLEIDLQVWHGLRAHRQFQLGQADVAYPDFIPATAENAVSSEPFNHIRRYLFTRPGAGVKTLDDMVGKPVSLVQGYYYLFTGPWEDKINWVRATTERDSYRLLTLKKVDALVAVDHDILAMAASQGHERPDYDPDRPVEVLPLAYSFHDTPEGREIRDKFSRAIMTLRDSGELARILLHRADDDVDREKPSSIN